MVDEKAVETRREVQEMGPIIVKKTMIRHTTTLWQIELEIF
jgi:hypothetical protein